MIVLMGVLGGLAVWRMNLAAVSSADLPAKFVPEVIVAQKVATGIWSTRFNMRNYTLTGDEGFLLKSRKGIAALKDDLKAADELAKTYPDLVALRQGVVDSRIALDTWEADTDKMESERNNLKVQRGLLDAAGKAYMLACQTMRASEEKAMKTEIATNMTPATLDERLIKLGMVQRLRDHGMAIQLNNFKAQAVGDMDALRDVIKDFAPLEEACTRLEPLFRQQENIDQLHQLREYANSYKAAMEAVLKIQLTINELKEKLADSAEVLVARGEGVSTVGLGHTAKAATEGAQRLNVTIVILLVGLFVALIAGVVVAWLSTRAIAGPIREGAQVLVAAAGEVSATVSQIAASAGETASAVAETSTTIDEVRQTAQLARESAKGVSDGAQSAVRTSHTGSDAVRASVDGLKRIGEQMKAITGSVMSMSEKSQAIGDIITTVNDLAEQSNLLAVNASM